MKNDNSLWNRWSLIVGITAVTVLILLTGSILKGDENRAWIAAGFGLLTALYALWGHRKLTKSDVTKRDTWLIHAAGDALIILLGAWSFFGHPGPDGILGWVLFIIWILAVGGMVISTIIEGLTLKNE